MEHLPHILEHPTARLNGAVFLRRSRRALLPGLLPDADTGIHQDDVPEDFGQVSTRRLRIVCNRTYQLLDEDRPSAESRARYHAVVEELERREALAVRSETEDLRSGRRDTAVLLPLVPGGLRRRIRPCGTARAAGRDRR
ncbi:hypothetical protein [Arthrobacter sp. TMS2-4]